MQSKFRPIYLFLLLLIASYISIGRFNNPPNGNTGAPGDGLCTDCHSPPASGQDGNVQISGLPGTIMPNTTYTLTLTANNPNGQATFGGFQMVALDGSNNDVGSLSNASSSSTITPSGGRTYWEHNPAKSYGASTAVSWTVDWTSPSGPNGENITLYGAANVANGDDDNTGDLIVTTTTSAILDVMAPPLVATITDSNDISCNGGNDGSATALGDGGVPPYSYNWSNGQNGPNLMNVMAGTYTVTVSDNDNSQATASVTLDQPATAVSVAIQNVVHVSCNGQNTGGAEAIGSGGSPGYTYIWSNGQNSPNLTMVAAGNYSVTVSDQNNCTANAMVSITQPDVLELDVINVIHVDCNGNSTGSATVQGNGGTPGYTYLWSNGQNGPSISSVGAGGYTVTVTDQNNCTADVAIVINEPQILSVSIDNFTNVSCYEGSDGSATAMPSGGTLPYSYLWSNGQSEITIEDLSANIYSVTVTDLNSCTAEATISITQPDSIAIFIDSVRHVSCEGLADGSIFISVAGGNPDYTYNWSNGADTKNNLNIGAGTYTVTVTDQNDCSKIASVTVNDALGITIQSDSIQNPLCPGDSTGFIQLTSSGGTPPLTFLWSNGELSEDLSGIPSGMYTVTVTDQNGCTNSASYNLTDPDLVDPNLVTTDETNAGSSDGTAMVTPTGGEGPYTVNWSTGDMGTTIVGLAPASYQVTVTDANGCIVSQDFTINPFGCSLSAMDSLTHIECFGDSTGSIQLVVSGANGDPTYSWSNGASTSFIQNLGAGMYTVTITDTSNCTLSETYTISQPPSLMLTVNSTDLSMPGANDGTAMATVMGGTMPYNYTWSNGKTDPAIDSLSPGVYTVTVTDQNLCTAIDSVSINDLPCNLNLDSTVSNISCSGGNDGAICIQVSGGAAPISYDWGQGPTADSCLSNLETGMYMVTATDANNCTISASFELSAPSALSDSLITIDASCAGGNDGSATLIVSGGTPPYDIIWSNDSTGTSISNLAAGFYGYQITDANNCALGNAFTISHPQPLIIQIDSIHDDENGSSTGAIFTSVSGGTTPYLYLWTNEIGDTVGNTEDIQGIPGDFYTIKVEDSNGCIAIEDSIEVEINVAVSDPEFLTSLNIYPNPVEDIATIHLTMNSIKRIRYNLVNMMGKTVLRSNDLPEGKMLDISLDMNNIDQGVYLLILEIDNSLVVRKIIKQ